MSFDVSTVEPSDITLTVFVKDTDGLRPLRRTNGYINNTWIQERVDYSASGSHKVSLKFNSSMPWQILLSTNQHTFLNAFAYLLTDYFTSYVSPLNWCKLCLGWHPHHQGPTLWLYHSNHHPKPSYQHHLCPSLCHGLHIWTRYLRGNRFESLQLFTFLKYYGS